MSKRTGSAEAQSSEKRRRANEGSYLSTFGFLKPAH